MNFTSENDKPQQDFTPHETDSDMLDARKIRCFPTVRRTFRQKQSNWRWRWKYFTRALQPISEQGENTKDDTSKVDDSDANLATNDCNENNLESPKVGEEECSEPNSDPFLNSDNENNSTEDTEPLKSKDDYSACIKLIEKFQEAVIDNAVRVIQAAFKRFRERRQFLKLRKSATVIQRSVRRWLRLKHLSERVECHLALNGNREENSEMQRNCSTSDELDKEASLDHVIHVSDNEEQEGRLLDETYVDVRGDCLFDHEGVTEDNGVMLEAVLEETDNQLENSFESLDASLSGSADNISDVGVYIDQCEDTSPSSDPDSLSLADSGIDMCSDTTVEATVTDECKCSSSENPLSTSSNVIVQEVITEHQ